MSPTSPPAPGMGRQQSNGLSDLWSTAHKAARCRRSTRHVAQTGPCDLLPWQYRTSCEWSLLAQELTALVGTSGLQHFAAAGCPTGESNVQRLDSPSGDSCRVARGHWVVLHPLWHANAKFHKSVKVGLADAAFPSPLPPVSRLCVCPSRPLSRMVSKLCFSRRDDLSCVHTDVRQAAASVSSSGTPFLRLGSETHCGNSGPCRESARERWC